MSKWVKSTKSSATNCVECKFVKSTKSEKTSCVEAAAHGDGVVVRNSKDPNGPSVFFTSSEWDAFVGGVREGEMTVEALRNA